jgi:hypothetical protein
MRENARKRSLSAGLRPVKAGILEKEVSLRTVSTTLEAKSLVSGPYENFIERLQLYLAGTSDINSLKTSQVFHYSLKNA